jgi:hypothetical protein
MDFMTVGKLTGIEQILEVQAGVEVVFYLKA